MKWSPEGSALLRERQFRLLFFGRTLSGVGDALVPIAVTFAVLDIGDASDLGLVLGSQAGARVVCLLAAGVWADRLPRHAVMIAADAVRACVQALLALAFFTDSIAVWQLAAGGAVFGAASAFFQPASTGLIAQIVGSERLQEANALLSLSRSAIQVAGPAVSGVVVATLGFGVVFAVDGVTFVASFLCLAALRMPRVVERARRGTMLGEIGEGFAEVRKRAWLVATLLCDLVSNIALATYFVLGPVIFDAQFDGARDWGLMLTSGAIGGLVGSAVALRFKPQHPLRFAYTFALVTPLQLVALAQPAPLALLLAGAGVVVVAIVVKNTFWTTMEQQHVPEHAIGRVDSIGWMVSLVVFPLSLALAGPVGEVLGVETTLIGVAALSVVAHLATVAVADVRNLRSLDARVEGTGTV